jgi:hypothetical protein
MKKQSPRSKFIKEVNFERLAGFAWDAMVLASTHDPEHEKDLFELRSRIEVLERQMERIGAPQYRTIRKGKPSC